MTRIILFTLFFFRYSFLAGQNWVDTLNLMWLDKPIKAIPVAEGIAIGCKFSPTNGASGMLGLVKYSMDGTHLSTQLDTIVPGNYFIPDDFIQTQDSGFFFIGYYNVGVTGAIYKLDKAGKEEWIKLHPLFRGSIDSTLDDGYIVCNGNSAINIVKIDSLANIIWTKTYHVQGMGVDKVISANDGGYLIAGDDSASRFTFLLKLDASGDSVWTNTYPLDNVPLFAIATTFLYQTKDSGFITGGIVAKIGTLSSAFLLKVDSIGNMEWLKKVGTSTGSTIAPTQDGGYILFGTDNYTLNLFKTDELGNEQWRKYITIVPGAVTSATSVIEVDGGEFVFAGGYDPPPGGGSDWGNIYIGKTNRLGDSSAVIAYGHIFSNTIAGCGLDVGDTVFKNIVTTTSGQHFYSSSTDENGLFFLQLEQLGLYTLNIHSLPYWELENQCINTPATISALSYNDTISIDLPLTAIVNCPLLSIDISTPLLRRCFSNTYTINYCNTGTINANNSYVEVTFDPFIQVVGSTLPWRTPQNGDTYFFDIGTVPVGTCGSFKINVNLSCSATLGQTHCVSAHIYPDTVCLPNIPVDNADITVGITCTASDSVKAVVTNVSSNDMTNPLNYKFFKDGRLILLDSFQLASQDSLFFYEYADGSTFSLVSEYSSGIKSATIEGCGINNSGSFSTGFFTILPQNDRSPFLSIDCQENIGSWDPNDKQVFPKGISEQKIIFPGTELEYKIRFQNTGTDTAFNIVIRDTVSSYLDITSIQPGAASHEHTFSLLNPDILEWRFTSIMLPDSGTNEEQSHGFVKYRIALKSSVPLNTEIKNRASIYFDNNEPIHTNETTNVLGEINVPVTLGTISKQNFSPVSIYPNPTNNILVIESTEFLYHVSIVIYDLLGNEFKTYTFPAGNKFDLNVSYLNQGFYIYSIVGQNSYLQRGKFSVVK